MRHRSGVWSWRGGSSPAVLRPATAIDRTPSCSRSRSDPPAALPTLVHRSLRGTLLIAHWPSGCTTNSCTPQPTNDTLIIEHWPSGCTPNSGTPQPTRDTLITHWPSGCIIHYGKPQSVSTKKRKNKKKKSLLKKVHLVLQCVHTYVKLFILTKIKVAHHFKKVSMFTRQNSHTRLGLLWIYGDENMEICDLNSCTDDLINILFKQFK